MFIYNSGKYVFEYIYSLYDYIINTSNYYYNLLFNTDYKYECLNNENDYLNNENNPPTPPTPKSMIDTISITNFHNIIEESSSVNNCVTSMNNSGLMESTFVKFNNLSNCWKCSVCNSFNSLSTNVCNVCLLDSNAVSFLHDVVNEMSNRTDKNSTPSILKYNIEISSPTSMLIREVLDELIDNIIDKNKKSIDIDTAIATATATAVDESNSLSSDWECL